MEKVIILTDENTGEFLDVVSPNTDLNKWAQTWIISPNQTKRYNDIEFWEGWNIFINSAGQIIISGDNGIIEISTKIHTIK